MPNQYGTMMGDMAPMIDPRAKKVQNYDDVDEYLGPISPSYSPTTPSHSPNGPTSPDYDQNNPPSGPHTPSYSPNNPPSDPRTPTYSQNNPPENLPPLDLDSKGNPVIKIKTISEEKKEKDQQEMPMLNNLEDGEVDENDDEFDFYRPNQKGGNGGIKKIN